MRINMSSNGGQEIRDECWSMMFSFLVPDFRTSADCIIKNSEETILVVILNINIQ